MRLDSKPETAVVTEMDRIDFSAPMVSITAPMPKNMNSNKPDDHNQVSKHDSGLASNEFGTEMHTPEVVVIILILCLWVLSLRKLVKHFDKLRSTQYREIPYKYRLKDPENIANVKIVNNQNESVIYSRDPIKSLRSKSIACGDTYSTNNNGRLSLFGKKLNDTKKKSVVDSMLFGTGNKLQPPSNESFNYKKNLSNSLNCMHNYGAHRQCRNHSMSHMLNTKANLVS